jgi:hypothetical protein
MLKWTGKEAHIWICDMFNDALQHGMPYDWTTNWIKPLHKGGDVNNVNNYRTIMVGSLMAKLFGCIMESKISVWAKKVVRELMDKLAFGNTIAPLITLSPFEY